MTPPSPLVAATAVPDPAVQEQGSRSTLSLRATSTSQQDPHYVAWARARQQEERRRRSLLVGLQAQADPSEAAGIAGPITAWAEDHARQKRRHANAIAGLHRSSHGLAG